MKLCYWKRIDRIPNFGDVLNLYLWPRLLPNVFDEDTDTIFIGIGTLLEIGLGAKLNLAPEHLASDEPKSSRLIIMGSGAGYSRPPIVDPRWEIYALRGPITARLLGVDERLAIADPAILVRHLFQSDGRKSHRYSVMFNHATANSALKNVCEAAGFQYIDPLDDVEHILASIARTETLITEALHGAIVADALRVPWIPVQTRQNVLPAKWHDWCQSIDQSYQPSPLPGVIQKLYPDQACQGVTHRIRHSAKSTILQTGLKRIARKASPILSAESVLEDRSQRLLNAIASFQETLASCSQPARSP